MPRIQRRIRLNHGLTTGQRAALLLGPYLGRYFGQGFDAEADMEHAWRTHRELLMADHSPGTRPAAFYKFELGTIPERRRDELALLFTRGLIDGTEAREIRRGHPKLAAEYERLIKAATQSEKESV
jgi:hypothetical protein